MSSKSSRIRSGFTLRRQPPVVDMGCNCRRRPKLFSLFSSSSLPFRGAGGKPKSPTNASSSSTTTAFTATTVSGTTATTSADSQASCWGPASFANNSLYEDPPAPPEQQPDTRRRRRQQQRRRRRRAKQQEAYGRVARESVPVAVESAEPYEDFRESMVQMVVEKEIYAWDDLNDLLRQFLTLNSPRHHPLILHAFADLWTRNGLFSPPSPCQL